MGYRPQSRDTSPEIDRLVFQKYREMSDLESIERVWELNEWACERARAGLRQQFPGASEREIELRLAVVKYGPELISKATGRSVESLVGEHGAA